jgi:sulfatase maturation enzyme AslB (radical SAM superfamily)
LLHRLEQFKNLEIVVSLEGTGAMNNYLRYPSDWEEIKNNIELIANRLPQAHVSVNHTLQHASAYSLPALVEFCHDQNLSLHTTMIQGMPHMTLASVPPEDLEKFINWVNTTDCLRSELKNFLQNVIKDIQFDIGLHQKFIDYISVLDNIRKNNYNKVFNPSKV